MTHVYVGCLVDDVDIADREALVADHSLLIVAIGHVELIQARESMATVIPCAALDGLRPRADLTTGSYELLLLLQLVIVTSVDDLPASIRIDRPTVRPGSAGRDSRYVRSQV